MAVLDTTTLPLTGIEAIAAGTYYSMALTATGQVLSWGLNSNGQLGDGTTNRSYPGLVEAVKVREKDAYLAFARADGAPFLVDNDQQGECEVPLDPFYLVWDNFGDQELQKMGSADWPYQVDRIQLVSEAHYLGLIPHGASSSAQAGFTAFKENCLTCHHINDIGGRKRNKKGIELLDMKLLVNGKSRDYLRSWINDPGKMDEDATMPAFNTNFDYKERERLIDHILDYLEEL